MTGRSVLVHALAPEGTTARRANDRLNEYVADRRRGPAVWHDHSVGVHGGAVAEPADPRFWWQRRSP